MHACLGVASICRLGLTALHSCRALCHQHLRAPTLTSTPPRHLQKKLRAARLAVAGAPTGGSAAGAQAATYPLRPIGTARTCFSQRNGTPRQPLLVPAARAVVTLR